MPGQGPLESSLLPPHQGHPGTARKSPVGGPNPALRPSSWDLGLLLPGRGGGEEEPSSLAASDSQIHLGAFAQDR